MVEIEESAFQQTSQKTRTNLRARLETVLAPVGQKYGYRDLTKEIPVRIKPQILLVSSDSSPSASDLFYSMRQEFPQFDWMQEEYDEPAEIMLAMGQGTDKEEVHKLMENVDHKLTMRLERFVSFHQRRLMLLLQALSNFAWKQRMFALQWGFMGFLSCLSVGLVVGIYVTYVQPYGPVTDQESTMISAGVGIVAYLLWWLGGYTFVGAGHFQKNLGEIDRFVKLTTREEEETWKDVRPLAVQYLTLRGKIPRAASLRADRRAIL